METSEVLIPHCEFKSRNHTSSHKCESTVWSNVMVKSASMHTHIRFSFSGLALGLGAELAAWLFGGFFSSLSSVSAVHCMEQSLETSNLPHQILSRLCPPASPIPLLEVSGSKPREEGSFSQTLCNHAFLRPHILLFVF